MSRVFDQSKSLTFKRLLQIVLAMYGQADKSGFEKHFEFITVGADDSSVLAQVTANMSNAATHMQSLKKDGLEDRDIIRRQLYWNKFSAFMVDLIRQKARTLCSGVDERDMKNFFFNLGACRSAIACFLGDTEKLISPQEIMEKEYVDWDKINFGCPKPAFFDIYKNKEMEIVRNSLPFHGNTFLQRLREIVSEKSWIEVYPKLEAYFSEVIKQNSRVYSHKCSLLDDKNNIVVHTTDEEINVKLIEKLFSVLNISSQDVSFGKKFYEKTFLICRSNQSSQEFFVSSLVKEHMNTAIQKWYVSLSSNSAFLLGRVSGSPGSSICCNHDCQDIDAAARVYEKFRLLASAPADLAKDVFLQQLGEFCYLYINVMPFVGGSAAIGEWLMRGLAQSRGIDLGPFDQDKLSWDFSAFVHTSPVEYGKIFSTFFQSSPSSAASYVA